MLVNWEEVDVFVEDDDDVDKFGKADVFTEEIELVFDFNCLWDATSQSSIDNNETNRSETTSGRSLKNEKRLWRAQLHFDTLITPFCVDIKIIAYLYFFLRELLSYSSNDVLTSGGSVVLGAEEIGELSFSSSLLLNNEVISIHN
nr:9340_t:CDS:2 [Entrophospora candida]